MMYGRDSLDSSGGLLKTRDRAREGEEEEGDILKHIYTSNSDFILPYLNIFQKYNIMKSRGRDGWGKRNSSLCRLHFQALAANHDDGGSPEHSPGGLVPGHLGGHVHALSDARLPGQHGRKVGNLGHEQDDGAEPDPETQ